MISALADIRNLLRDLPFPDADAAAGTAARNDRLTKPPGSLGKLEEMAVSDHRVVYDCLKKYEDCLLSNGKYQLPNPKGRIYAYCEALNIETHPSKRNYGDSEYWDLNTPALEPLEQFLRDLPANVPLGT